jgi:hypothetical protein
VGGRRPLFFLIAGVAALLLIPLSDAKLRYVPMVVAGIYFTLAALFGLEVLSRRRR